MQDWKQLVIRTGSGFRIAVTGLPSFALLISIVLASGACAVRRGTDFGHWAGRAENRMLTRVFNVKPVPVPSNGQYAVILPPIGRLDLSLQDAFQTSLLLEAQQRMTVTVAAIDPKGPLAEYMTEENLLRSAGVFDLREVARMGEVIGAAYVICIWVHEARLHAPQNWSLYCAVIDTKSGTAIAEMNAQFNCAEQEVMMALNDYLQSCRARKFDKTNLEIIAQSPREFQNFVAYECMKALSEKLWKR